MQKLFVENRNRLGGKIENGDFRTKYFAAFRRILFQDRGSDGLFYLSGALFAESAEL